LLAEEVQCLDRLFRQADDARRWKLAHACILS
jgi:hypothetical protein